MTESMVSGSKLLAVPGVDRMVALMVRSIELGHEERWPEALACLDEAVAINPWLPICHVDRARVLAELARYEEALDDCDHFLRYAAPLPEVQALRQQIIDDALAALGERLRARPDDLAALLTRGNLYMKTRLYAQALADYATILARDCGHVDALNNQGCVFHALNRHAEAMASLRAAAAAAPQRADLRFNQGNVWQALGRFDEARAAYRQALELAPQFAEAHLESAHCDLAEGNYGAGWRQFEWRWRTSQMKDSGLRGTAPCWIDASPAGDAAGAVRVAAATGKTLLVWAEQGAGDTLQFVRFVAQLTTLAGRVILRVPPALRRLLATVDTRIALIGDDEELPEHDIQCPLMSLPLALGIDAPPRCAPYLHARADDMALWRERLGARRALRVGLAWAGRQLGQTNPTRDIPLALLAPLVAQPIEWISLQKEVPAADAAALAGLPGLRSFAEQLGDYADTAALIMALDLVIAVDTSVAHLAGALGKPCWLLLRHSGEWRWLRERADTPWYPSLRLFRQTTPGDWSELIARVSATLAAVVAAGGDASAP